MERGILKGLTAFRWVAWTWMVSVTVLARDELRRPWLAVLLQGLALVLTAAFTVLFRTRPDALLRPGPIAAELAVGLGLVVGDGVAYGPGHAFDTAQSLGVAWPLFGVLSAGLAFGARVGAATGALMGLARLGGTLANGVALSEVTGDGGRVASHATSVVVYTVAGAMIGYMATLLRRAEREISAARAREEVARTLHDGVLQTLAVVERRAADPALARLAREQERELREWLFGVTGHGRQVVTGLGPALRSAAGRYEQHFGGLVQVLVADDVPEVGDERCRALAAAVGEALTNAGKHGRAGRVTVYVEPTDDGGVFCSVKDDGRGFDPATVTEGVGLSRSIRGRMAEMDGKVEIESRPGAGTEVRLWLPAS